MATGTSWCRFVECRLTAANEGRDKDEKDCKTRIIDQSSTFFLHSVKSSRQVSYDTSEPGGLGAVWRLATGEHTRETDRQADRETHWGDHFVANLFVEPRWRQLCAHLLLGSFN